MSSYQKIIWAEGVMLGQQHFQQWEHYIQHPHKLSQQNIHPLNWGVADLAIDESNLTHGFVQIKRCLALLPDFRWVDFDDENDAPLRLNLPAESPAYLNIYLSLPCSEQASGISGYLANDNIVPTWLGNYQNIKDKYDCSKVREVLLAHQNIKLTFDKSSLAQSTTIKLAVIKFDAIQGLYRIDKSYIPPVLNINASRNLSSWLIEFTGKIKQNIQKISIQKEKYSHSHNQFGFGDFIYFNLVKTLTTHLPKLLNIQMTQQLHPFHLYESCLYLLGELSGFSIDAKTNFTVISYDQNNLSYVFNYINESFDTLIEQAIPINNFDISLTRLSENLYRTTELINIVKEKTYCLAIHIESPSQDLIDNIQLQIKIASPSHINEIINSFTQGASLQYIAKPHKNILAKQNYQYFTINTDSNEWQSIIEEKSISFFVSQSISNLPIELISFQVL